MRTRFSRPGGACNALGLYSPPLTLALIVCLAAIALRLLSSPSPARGAVSSNIVISQVYGGGGNSGAPFTNDFVELFNLGSTTVSFSNWAIQYAASTGTTWQKVNVSGTLQPGQHFLIQLSGGANGSPLPTPDATGSIAMSASAGKVVLTNDNTPITNGVSCPSGSNVVDIVGYGSGTNCFEGSGSTPTISATAAAVRAAGGCAETDDNASDFAAGPVGPRNIASTIVPCGATTDPSGIGAASPNPVAVGNVVLLTVTVTPGANPTSADLEVTGNLSSIGGSATQRFHDEGTNGDDNAGDKIFSFQTRIPSNITPGAKTLPVKIRDAQSRSGSLNINLTVQPAPPPGNVVISQIFGGGGNSGALFTHDFIELFNRSAAPVNLSGWSAQYASSTGASWQKVDLGGTLQPGQYYLIRLASGGANGETLSSADAFGTISMASTTGKVALASNTTLLNASCPIGPNVVDFVGYGSSANCFEGSDSTPSPSSDEAAVRIGRGCADTNDNATNFLTLAPAPRNTASEFNVCGKGARFDDFSFKIARPATCAAPGSVIPVEARFTNTGEGEQRDNVGTEFTIQLPAELIPIAKSCAASGGSCAIKKGGLIEWNGTAQINETIVITLQTQVKDGAAAGLTLQVAAKLNYDPDGDDLNDAMLTKNESFTINCVPVGPGEFFPASSEAGDQRAGSVLVYPIYSSRMADLDRENTRINITNTDPSRRVAIHLFFSEDDSASVADAFLCLTPNQTTSFLASDLDPDVNGYLIAVAVDERTGCPISFNHLIGDEYVKLNSGHAANLVAEAFAALSGAAPICPASALTVDIDFDGVSYNAAPRILVADNIPSFVDGNSPLLVIVRIDGSLATGLSTVGQIMGIAYDDLENPASFEFNTSRRQFRSVISATFPRTAPRMSSLIPPGHTGWMKFWRESDGAIIGCLINYNRDATANASAFNQGHNLHKLTLTTDASFTVPLFAPSC